MGLINPQKAKLVIFDSSGLISLVKDDDALYSTANEVAKAIENGGWQLILPSTVLCESLNTIGRHVGKQFAILVGERMLELHSSGSLSIVELETLNVQNAIDIMKTASGNPSFVDCSVMALANEYGTPYVFGFDATFSKNGYGLPKT
jgi:predicted nucleic acid-binding protein